MTTNGQAHKYTQKNNISDTTAIIITTYHQTHAPCKGQTPQVYSPPLKKKKKSI